MISTGIGKKVFKWIGYSTLSVILLLITLLTILSLTYDKTIIKYLKKYLNEHLLTEIIVNDIDFSMIKKFPYATVEFSNVVIKSRVGLDYSSCKKGDEDTLMNASKIYFQFGLLGLMKNEYHLKKIHLIEGKINILTDRSGRVNYSIWKSLGKEKSKEDYHVEFQNVMLSSFDLYYINHNNPLVIHSFIKKSIFNGSFSQKDGLYALKSGLHILEAGKEGKVYVRNLPVFIDFKASSKEDELTINQGKIMLNKLSIQLQGNILLDPALNADLTFTSTNFGLDEIFSMISPRENSRINDFLFEGKGKINARIKGPFFAKGFPQIQTDFTLINGSVTNKNTKSKLSHVDITGTFSGTKPDNCRLVIRKMEARLSTGKINGNGIVTNLQNPGFTAELYSTINLSNLHDLIEFDSVEYLKGMVNASLKAEGLITKDESLTLSRLLSRLTSGSLELDDCSIKIKGLDYVFQDINGKTHIGNNITFQDFAMTINQTNFLVTGTFENVINYFNDKESVINANLYIYSRFLDGNSFISNQHGSTDAAVIKFPGHLHLKAKINADEFRIGKFSATEMRSDLVYNDSILNINNFNIKFIDGIISGNSLINQQKDSCIQVNCTADLKRIDIQQLFTSFNNFSQSFILDENLRGKLDGNVTFTACWSNHLNFIPSSLTAQAGIIIINGELLKFDPMLSLSKYIDVDELKHIRFKTLKNTIYIYDQNIRIPEMLINTSAFNIALSGTHSFINEFDYRLRVALSDVLFKKAKRKKKEIDDYLIMENDVEKTIIPVSIIGTPDNYTVAFDSKRAFDLIRENLQQQGTEMKGLFDGKSTPLNEQAEKKNNQHIIEWEEDQPDQPQQKEIKTPPSGDEIRIKWKEEDSLDINFFN